ncbi:MAG: TIGR00159 family protein [Flavobacteriales bacterium]|nr:TIGR00159 family protein [Flavobacteriales bacterium]
MLDSFGFNIIDIFDIILVGLLLYYAYKLVRGTAAINIFIGFVILYLIWKITSALKMDLLSSILGGFMSVGAFALIVLFQQEIRKILLMLGSSDIANKRVFSPLFKVFKVGNNEIETSLDIETLVNTLAYFKKINIGALIVLERTKSLDYLKTTGKIVNMEVSQAVLECIFFKNGPLHDGAIIIKNNSVINTSVILPLSKKNNLPSKYGLRHRAAIGLTEETDAIAIVVSEESGTISLFKNSEKISFNSYKDLKKKIQRELV